MNLTKDFLFTYVEPASAAAQTALDSDAVDMANFDAVLFVATIASIAITGVVTVQAQGRNETTDAWADLTGATVTRTAVGAETNITMALEIIRPRQRYVRVTVTRATANAALSSIVAMQKAKGRVPLAQGANVYTNVVLSPAAA
jgi:hypothetical protein